MVGSNVAAALIKEWEDRAEKLRVKGRQSASQLILIECLHVADAFSYCANQLKGYNDLAKEKAQLPERVR